MCTVLQPPGVNSIAINKYITYFRQIELISIYIGSSNMFRLLSIIILRVCRSQWPYGVRCRSSVARLIRSWVRIPPGEWMFVFCECCVLSGRGLCDGLITRPEESYRLWCVVVCDQETSKTRRLKPANGLWKIQPQWVVTAGKQRQQSVYLTDRPTVVVSD